MNVPGSSPRPPHVSSMASDMGREWRRRCRPTATVGHSRPITSTASRTGLLDPRGIDPSAGVPRRRKRGRSKRVRARATSIVSGSFSTSSNLSLSNKQPPGATDRRAGTLTVGANPPAMSPETTYATAGLTFPFGPASSRANETDRKKIRTDRTNRRGHRVAAERFSLRPCVIWNRQPALRPNC